MPRYLISSCLLTLLAAPPAVRGDAFDNYTNDVLLKAPKAQGVQALKQLTLAQMADHAGVLPGSTGAFLMVRTREGRLSKLLVQPARQKLQNKKTVPILMIERFVTYKPEEERAVQVQGGNIRLFEGFQFSLDLGQVVPPDVAGDLRFTLADGKPVLEALGKAELFLITRPLPEATPKKAAKVVIGSKFEPRYFEGDFKLHDDGRRSGTLHLKVHPGGDVEGSFYSDQGGEKYEVNGKIGKLPNAIEFTITFPRSQQTYTGWMFTGNGRAIAGSSRWQERVSGFYAVRIE